MSRRVQVVLVLPWLLLPIESGAGEVVQLSTADKQLILDFHNAVRSTVASGEQPGATGKLPPAANMNRLLWDEGLAKVAADHAATCPGIAHNPDLEQKHLAAHRAGETRYRAPWIQKLWSGGRRDGIFTGENMLTGTGEVEPSALPARMQTEWADEALTWQFGPHDAHCSGPSCRHFTQMIWAATRYVGCALVTGCEGGFSFVCDYHPVGNFNAAAPYVEGSPCSACDRDRTECDEGLCAGCPDPWFPDPYQTNAPARRDPPASCPDVPPVGDRGDIR